MDRTANYLKFIAIGVISGLTTISCNDSFMKETTRNKTSGLAALSTTIDEAGNISATIDPNATTTQVLKFSTGNLAGSAIAIPPGALAIPVSITVGEGPALGTSDFLQELGITNNTVTPAGPSVSFLPNQTVEASNPFTLSIPLTTASLALLGNEDNIVVMYHWTKVVNGKPEYYKGIIPGEEVIISSNKVSFQTTKFGTFQLGKSEKKITQQVKIESKERATLVKDLSNLLIGTWEMCSSENSGGSGSYSEPPFSKPVFGTVQFTYSAYPGESQNLHFSIRGDSRPLTFKKYTGPNCEGNPTEITHYGNVGFTLANYSVESFKLTDSQSPPGESACLDVYPKPEPLPKVQITHIEGKITAHQPDLLLSWDGNLISGYKIEIHQSNTCSDTDPVLTDVPTGTNKTIQIDNLHIKKYVRIMSRQSGEENITTACTPIPVISQVTDTNAPNINTLAQNNNFHISLSWNHDSSATPPPQYRIDAFTSSDCSGDTSKPYTPEPNAGYHWFENVNNELRSLKVVNITDSANPISSGCAYVSGIPRGKTFDFAANHVGSRWIGVNWNTEGGLTKADLTLTMHQGLDCTGSSQSISLDNNTNGGTQTTYGWLSVNNLTPITRYSLKMALKNDSSKWMCQNIMTTETDIKDWSEGNTIVIPSTTTDLKLEMNTSVKDGKTYKLLVSFNGGAPTDRYSTVIPSSGEQQQLLLIPAAEAKDKIITAIAPPGCWIQKPYGGQSSSIYLGETQSQVAPGSSIFCDGTNMNNGGGGYDSFGAVPNMTAASKKMELQISSDTVTMIESLFKSNDCAVGTRVSRIIESGTAIVQPADKVPDTYPIDFTLKDIVGIIFEYDGVKAANAFPDRFGCGLSGWVKDTPQNMSRGGCATLGKTEYKRLKIVEDQLYTCENEENKNLYGKTPDTRIPTCDITSASKYFQRKKNLP